MSKAKNSKNYYPPKFVGDDWVEFNNVSYDGVIDALFFDRGGWQYLVVYWHGGIRHSEWVHEGEIHRVKEKKIHTYRKNGKPYRKNGKQ